MNKLLEELERMGIKPAYVVPFKFDKKIHRDVVLFLKRLKKWEREAKKHSNIKFASLV
jgi:hypothetical protein